MSNVVVEPIPTQRPTLGVVAISHNEEGDMPGFLENIMSWVDEIVIVDDGSTDRTAEIARDAGPKVKFLIAPRQTGEGYCDQRNKGIAAAASDWLLHMDIDERVTPDLAEEILRAFQDPSKDRYRYRRLNFFLHRQMRGGGWQRWNNVQLARRQFFLSGKLHEHMVLPVSERVGQLRSYMWHLGDADYVERMRKNTIYMEVEAERWLARGTRYRWYDVLLRPPWYFIRPYLLQGGWRDGVVGLIWALHCATGSVRFFALLWERQRVISREALEDRVRQSWLLAAPRLHRWLEPTKSRLR